MIARSRRLSASIGGFCDHGFVDFQQIKFIQEIEDNLDLLRPLVAGFLGGVNDNLLDELVHDGGCQFRDVYILALLHRTAI